MRRKSFRSILAVLIFGLTMIAQITPVLAMELGGWDENEGYYTNSFQLRAQSPPIHTGKAEETVINGTSAKRAVGQTTWTGVYHYTRARMEDILLGINFGVLTDSGKRKLKKISLFPLYL